VPSCPASDQQNKIYLAEFTVQDEDPVAQRVHATVLDYLETTCIQPWAKTRSGSSKLTTLHPQTRIQELFCTG
jgi:hypothetical protein